MKDSREMVDFEEAEPSFLSSALISQLAQVTLMYDYFPFFLYHANDLEQCMIHIY